uniref:two-partner secretion domain-containing protein n=1 Tax=Okeania sp. SIO2F4 TaxID=2607790 RepID=UPI0025FDFA11|nr:filamentous hemagglutinin N-terminal domain-containing protein [Okeania sp. SIO2F4]
MKPNFADSYKITALTIMLGTLAAAPAKSQPITPANDGTNTTINQNGNQFDIQGGTRSGANLFHSFDQFNVNSGQTANFVTTQDTSNILGRVTGGNASYINGLIQVIGGNSNLFLMNPAGIMFGPNASLNIPASFSVTTATGIGFDNNNYWFKAMGTNDYANLVGEPSGYRFNVSNPGAIVNEANLTLNPGENLTFVGGTVINTGQLSTPGGNITIAAVEGGSTLKISQPGHVLSLEVPSTTGSESETVSITPQSLPGLLTGGSDMSATSITVNESGEVVLTASNTVVEDVAGTAIASGSLDVSSGEDVGGQVNVLGDRVALIDTNINANGLNGGGKVLIGGNSEGTVFNSQDTFVNSGSTIYAYAIEDGDGGDVTIWSDGITNFAGQIDVAGGLLSGNGGFVEVRGQQELTFYSSSTIYAYAIEDGGDVKIWSDGITNFAGEIDATGGFSGNGGFVEVRGQQELTFDSGSTIYASAMGNGDGGNVKIWSDGITNFAGEIDVAGGLLSGNGGLVEVRGQQELTFDTGSTISANAFDNGDGGDVKIWSDGTINFAGEIDATGGEFSGNGGFVEVTGQELTFDGTVDVTAALGEDGTILLQPETITIGQAQGEGEPENSNNSQIAQDENADVTISAENIGQLSGNVILEADNDITVNEKIETDSSVELKAGRSININADIDTSVGNGNIDLLGNNDEMNVANRSEGAASINQLDGTTLNAGSGTINIELGNLGEVGDINLANLTTTGQVLVNANGGNIARVSENSIINAGSVLFQTSGSGGIGLTDAPLQLNVENLEAVSGSGGVFFDLGNVNIGGVSEDVDGISASGGNIEIKSEGNVTLTENISADGAINIEATGDISATGSGISSNGENVSLSATNISIADEFDETSGDADIKLEATNNITVEDIEDDVLEFLPGDGEIEFRADVDGDGVGVVQMLDNQADIGSDPNTFENGADTIKTNGRNLTIAGAEIVLGNIDTSLSTYSLFNFNVDVDEGGAIPTEGTTGDATFTFTVDGDLGTVEDLDVRFSAAHTWNSDLEVYLTSPEGQEVTLFAGVGGDGDNFQDTVLNDDASASISSGNAPFNGTYRPQGNLADFNGENPNGTWTLTVKDTYPTADDGTLYRAGDAAPWGTAVGTQLLLRTPVVQSGGGNGGAINIEATHGDISVANIRSLSKTGDGGTVDLKANNNIITGPINSSSNQGIGGDINLNAISGNIDTLSLDTSSFDGDGGNVEITAAQDINTADITASSWTQNSGNITIESTAGAIDLTEGLNASSSNGNGGNIQIKATENITTAYLTAISWTQNAGNITIESTAGGITAQNDIDARGKNNGGNIQIIGVQDITTSGITTESYQNAGKIRIESTAGSINTTAGSLFSH